MIIPDIAWAILLFLAGCALVVLEVFIPSGGIISILAGVALIASIVIASWEGPTTGPATGFVFFAGAIFGVRTIVARASKYGPKKKMGKAFLGGPPREEEVVPDAPRRGLIGRVGV